MPTKSPKGLTACPSCNGRILRTNGKGKLICKKCGYKWQAFIVGSDGSKYDDTKEELEKSEQLLYGD